MPKYSQKLGNQHSENVVTLPNFADLNVGHDVLRVVDVQGRVLNGLDSLRARRDIIVRIGIRLAGLIIIFQDRSGLES